MKILVTGAAGFIGYHLVKRLLHENYDVVGYDNLNDYYDIELKKGRLRELQNQSNEIKGDFFFYKYNLENLEKLQDVFEKHNPSVVINLAAQAGVRFSIVNPSTYISSNLVGFSNILECCRKYKTKHLLYASSSSVYGGNKKIPFGAYDAVDHPISIYAATKRGNELMAHTYSHLYNLPTTGLRFFTAYGPWGRPDMALFLFTKSILEGKNIDVYNNGQCKRDFTFVDDVIECIFRLINKVPKRTDKSNFSSFDPSSSWAPFNIFNIGNSDPRDLLDFIQIIEDKLNKKAKKKFLPMQPGDVESTASDISSLYEFIDYKPNTPLDVGVGKFIDWYRNFYQI